MVMSATVLLKASVPVIRAPAPREQQRRLAIDEERMRAVAAEERNLFVCNEWATHSSSNTI